MAVTKQQIEEIIKENGVWVDCPICGEEGSMEFRKNQVFTAGKINVEGLSGYFCRSCSEGFYDSDSKNKIKSALYEAKKY